MKRVLPILIVVLSILMLSCTGKQGPTGPQGEKGDPGPGSRIVYTSTGIIPNNGYIVLCPEVKRANMPAVSVYVSVPGDDFWTEIPVYETDGPSLGSSAHLQEGIVYFNNCIGFLYRIVIVIQ